jgi:hypothetical protein
MRSSLCAEADRSIVKKGDRIPESCRRQIARSVETTESGLSATVGARQSRGERQMAVAIGVMVLSALLVAALFGIVSWLTLMMGDE